MGNGNFKIGDKVKRISNPYDDVKIGTTGIVTKINDGYDTVRVKIDCTGVKGTWAYSYIEKVDDQPTTIIYRKGRETIATLKDGNQIIKTAKAICNPKDEFNAEYGAKLAFARLYGMDEQVTETLLNGIKDVKTDGNFKARCIKTHDAGLTVGKVYEFKNGYSRWNDGARLPQFESNGISSFRNFTDLEKWFSVKGVSKFEEVIEEFIPSRLPIAPITKVAATTNQSEPQYTEVQRQAEVGELIKIVKKGAHGPELNVGDIHRVIGKANFGTIGTDKGNRFIGTEHNEYVVLVPIAVSSQPKATIDITSISNDELLTEVSRRLKK